MKSPYLKCGEDHSVSGYLHYIGTRERVELLPDDRPPTRKQEQFITKLVKYFPNVKELNEFSGYETKPTKANASSLITRALEENWSALQKTEGYMKYIATRPRAERLGGMVCLVMRDGVDLAKAMEELDHYTGKVWTHILSLKRKDATRLDCDNAKVWMNLLRTNHNDIAAMNIPPNHFRWYAAFHDEVKHPHVHMMAWSAVPGEAYLTREGIRKIKSTLTNQIFRQEMLHTYEQKSQSQDEVVREARQTIRKLPRRWLGLSVLALRSSRRWRSWLNNWKRLRERSPTAISKPVKKTVDEVVDKLEELQVVRACYDQWCRLQGEVESCYHDKPREKKSCPRRRSSGRSRTPSFRRRNAFGWRRSPSRMMTWLSAMSRNRCRASPLPAGNYGKSSGTRPFL